MRPPYLLPFLDSPAGANDNFVSSLKRYHLSHTVRCTRMVDIPTKTEFEKGNPFKRTHPLRQI